jgi:hypothetical protein
VTPQDEVERFFRHLVDVLSETEPERLKRPIQVSEIYQSVLPYRHHRSALGFDTNEDYEMALLRLLAGDGGFLTIDPPEVQDLLAEEAQSINPNPGAFREYAAARVYLNSGAVRTVTEAHEAYAPPPDDEEEGDGLPEKLRYEEESPFAPGPAVLDITTAKIPALDERPGEADPEGRKAPYTRSTCAYCGEDLPQGRTVKFCPFCGRDLRIIDCESCGAELQAGWRYCINCGDPIGG